MNPDTIRDRIDAIDVAVLDLLNERLTLAGQQRAARGSQDHPCVEPQTELDTLTLLRQRNRGPMTDETLRILTREILAASHAVGRPATVAFLGPVATFTHQAALAMFGGGAHYAAQPTIADVFDAVSRGSATCGVVPVENSTEGAVTHTLDMFADTQATICAEINMVIHHNLVALCERDAIRTLYSHPQVFGQCRRWLHRNLPEVALVEVASTTEAAARCRNEPGAAALASHAAAERYQLNLLAERVEDLSGNMTRFIVIGNQMPEPTGDDKTSILFVVRDRVGALYDSLQPFSRHAINMTFIESRPSRRKSWEYHFFVDFTGHVSDPSVRQALEELGEHCQLVKILGSYPRSTVAT